MMRLKPNQILVILSTLILACAAPMSVRGQCTHQVVHLSGSQQIGCNTVTVVPDGSAGANNTCTYGPYFIGHAGDGSYTFTFSPPVPGVTIDIAAINNNIGNREEVSVEINGVFYPLTVPGSPDGCNNPAMITPGGRLGAFPGQVASWNDIHINTSITSIKLENITISGAPNGSVFSLYFCSDCCATDAGEITSSPLHLCPGNTATVPAATQPFLESDDILRYILFSDPANILGSILATGVTPVFAFNPAIMQTGVTYYIAAIAGNNLNGNVDLNDPCLDISNAIPVTWHPNPAVTFAVADPNVCAGACTTVTANFTGTAPFVLTYTTSASGPVTQTFPNNPGTFQLCTATGSQPGNWVVQATKVVDAWCICE